jgi:hypothetical protein
MEGDRAGERFATTSAALLTLLFHLALVLWIPWNALSSKPRALAPPAKEPVEYTLEPLTPEEMKYVETNPNAPILKPTEPTPNVGSRDQRAAQPNPEDKSKADTPRVKGEQEQSNHIVVGDMRKEAPATPPPSPAMRPAPPTPARPSQPTPPSPPTPPARAQPTPPARPAQPTPTRAQPTPPAPPSQVQPKPEQTPTPPLPPETTPPPPEQLPPGIEPPSYQGTPNTGEGEGVRLQTKPVESTGEQPAAPPPPPPPAEPPASPLATVQEVQPAPAPTPTPPSPPSTPSNDGATPMPRRQVQVRVPSGPLMNSNTSAGNPGVLAISSNFSQFGAYQSRLEEAISSQWYQLCDRYNFSSSDYGTRVIVLFTLDQQGTITSLQVVPDYSNASRGATLLCENAVAMCSPFGPWTKDMAALLGTEQTVRITFYYR